MLINTSEHDKWCKLCTGLQRQGHGQGHPLSTVQSSGGRQVTRASLKRVLPIPKVSQQSGTAALMKNHHKWVCKMAQEGAHVFNAVPSKILRVVYSYFPLTLQWDGFLCLQHTSLFFFFLTIQTNRQGGREWNKGPIVQLQISMQGSLLLPGPFHLSAIGNFTHSIFQHLFITDRKAFCSLLLKTASGIGK